MSKVLQFQTKDKKGAIRTKGSFEIKNQTDTTADLFIMGDIVSDEWGKWCDDDTCPSDIIDFLKNLDGVSMLNLHINSGGGSVFAGIAIYNMLKRHSATITTYIDGIAASIASVIACAGDKIIIPKNATFMIHKPSNGYFFTMMNADQLRKDADTLDTCQKSILNTYMTKVKEGVTEEQINALINAETWLVGNDVSEYFDFEIEESNQAVACSSAYFDKYENTPQDLVRDGQDPKQPINAEEVAQKVISILDKREQEKQNNIKNDLLKDLDSYGK
jgi:ATP-dependent Clp protease, protease subunit